MDLNRAKERLREQEAAITARIERMSSAARDEMDDAVRDSGDASRVSELKDEQLLGVEGDRDVLDQVRAALARIDAGTYGACVVDGEAIEEARLEAVPWTPYCLEHQEARETQSPPRATSL